jgi:SAM-dependent methyltransferase
MNLRDLQKNWEHMGRNDPLWAIITSDEKRGGKWDAKEFFALGQREVADVMQYAAALRLDLVTRRALDFGCGVGRLTQPLAGYFEKVDGVDIAPSMIELARTYNRHGDRVEYHLNASGNLELFADGTFDFIYTNITLQHMEPRHSKCYLKEFLRLLTPQGILIFQLPSELRPAAHPQPSAVRRVIRHLAPQGLVDLYHRVRWGNLPHMEMHGIRRECLVEFLEMHGAGIVDIADDQSAGDDWISFRYCVRKRS